MKIKNSKVQPLVLATKLLIIAICMSCINKTHSEDNKKREVVVYSKCSSEEASSDILYSVNVIKEQLTKKSISVKMDDEKKICGYLFVNGTKKKKISVVLTDIELLEKVNKFFE